MKYVSTRGGDESLTFPETVLAGLSRNGGLFVPQELPRFSNPWFEHMRGRSYPSFAHQIISTLAPHMSDRSLLGAVQSTYTNKIFGNAVGGNSLGDIIPVSEVAPQLYLVGLSDGPTLAFKDVALQLLGRLFEIVLNGKPLNILGATTGDTGPAAEEAMLGRENIRVFMLSPKLGMSAFQAAQMWGINDPMIHNIVINGTFDDCQRVVKHVMEDNDGAFKKAYSLGAVNSINWARIAAQVVYYFWTWNKMPSSATCFDVAIPTGNFGNMYAAYIAREMGVPIRHLVLATNENDVLHDFFQHGVYKPRAETIMTSSPSMNITAASNFERYIYHLFNGDVQKVASLWASLSSEGQFDLSGDLKHVRHSGIVSRRVNDEDCREAIRSVYSKSKRIIDPHTAVAMHAAIHHAESGVPMAVMETAQPCKFDGTIEDILGKTAPRPSAFNGIEERPQFFTTMDPNPERVKDFIRENV